MLNVDYLIGLNLYYSYFIWPFLIKEAEFWFFFFQMLFIFNESNIVDSIVFKFFFFYFIFTS